MTEEQFQNEMNHYRVADRAADVATLQTRLTTLDGLISENEVAYQNKANALHTERDQVVQLLDFANPASVEGQENQASV